MTDIADFLLARINEMSLEYGFTSDDEGDDYNNDEMLAHCDALRKVVEHHKLWPVLVEKKPEVTMADVFQPDFNNVVFKMNQELAWATEQSYIKHFGVDPPTAPILRYLVQPYSNHPDFNPDWIIK